MTHDELLEKLNRYSKRSSLIDSLAWNAVRSVIEFHKPYESKITEDETMIGCSCILELPPVLNPYPCPTIQIIEKEIK